MNNNKDRDPISRLLGILLVAYVIVLVQTFFANRAPNLGRFLVMVFWGCIFYCFSDELHGQLKQTDNPNTLFWWGSLIAFGWALFNFVVKLPSKRKNESITLTTCGIDHQELRAAHEDGTLQPMNILILQNDGNQEGPFTAEQIQARLAEGSTSLADLAWYEGLPEWKPLGDVLGPPPQEANPPQAKRFDWNVVAGYVLLAVGATMLIPLFWNVITGVGNIVRTELSSGPSVSLEDVKVEWEGRASLWSPAATVTVRNKSNSAARVIQVRAVFTNAKGVIVSDQEHLVTDLPGKRARGPIRLRSEFGNRDDLVLYEMTTDKSKRWTYELFVAEGLGDDWIKVKSGEVVFTSSIHDWVE